MPKHYIYFLAELRRFPSLGYKPDIIVLFGLDAGDRRALDAKMKEDPIHPPCQIDKEDRRFVLRGPTFNMMEGINVLTTERGYHMEFFPGQRNVPLPSGNVDDKFCVIHYLSKQVELRPTQES